jgi:hypothetical protein
VYVPVYVPNTNNTMSPMDETERCSQTIDRSVGTCNLRRKDSVDKARHSGTLYPHHEVRRRERKRERERERARAKKRECDKEILGACIETKRDLLSLSLSLFLPLSLSLSDVAYNLVI